MNQAEYKCLKESCGHEWKQLPGQPTCPYCGNLYAKWTNYEEVFEKKSKK